MTKEEIESKTRFLKTTWSADYAKGTALKALSSLTEAYAEIENLQSEIEQLRMVISDAGEVLAECADTALGESTT